MKPGQGTLAESNPGPDTAAEVDRENAIVGVAEQVGGVRTVDSTVVVRAVADTEAEP